MDGAKNNFIFGFMRLSIMAFVIATSFLAAGCKSDNKDAKMEYSKNYSAEKENGEFSSFSLSEDASIAGKEKLVVTKQTITLNNGVEMPIVGIGTFHLTPAEAEDSVYWSLMAGGRLIDTANAYMNERAVGRAIKKSGVPREEIFVTTKLWVSEYADADAAIDRTLARLQLDYIDLLLLHQPFNDFLSAYKAMERAVESGKVRAIGLSNFYGEKYETVLSAAKIKPSVLQIETPPLSQNDDIKEIAARDGIVLMAWYPLGGRGHTQTIFSLPAISDASKEHGKSAAQVVLRWHLQSGVVAIPCSSNREHVEENLDLFDFALTDDEMAAIKACDTGEGFYQREFFLADEGFTNPPPDFDSQE